MSFGRYLIGVAALLCVLASLGVGAAALRRYLLPNWGGAHARLAEIVTGCALLVGIMEVLGTVGLFRLVPIVLGSIAVGLALRLGLTSRSSAPVGPPPRRAARGYRRERPHPRFGGRCCRRAAPVDETEPPFVRARDHRRRFDRVPPAPRGVLCPDRSDPGDPLHRFRISDRAVPSHLRTVSRARHRADGQRRAFARHQPHLAGAHVVHGLVYRFGPGIRLHVDAGDGARHGDADDGRSNAGTADNDLLGVFFVMAALALWMRTADMPTTDTRAYRGGSIIAAVAGGLALSVKLNLVGPVGALTLVAIALTPSGRRRRRPAGGSGGWSSPVVTGMPVTSSRSGTRFRGSASAYCRRPTHRRCSRATTTPWPTTPPIPGSSATG